jgi:hypothetical protein
MRDAKVHYVVRHRYSTVQLDVWTCLVCSLCWTSFTRPEFQHRVTHQNADTPVLSEV